MVIMKQAIRELKQQMRLDKGRTKAILSQKLRAYYILRIFLIETIGKIRYNFH